MHIGLEIEGSFHKGMTLFVEADELLRSNSTELFAIAEANKCTAIYLGASRTILHEGHTWPAASLVGHGFAITAEVFIGENAHWIEVFKKTYPEQFEGIHIILSMDDTHSKIMRELKPSDDIKIQERDHGRLWLWRMDTAATVTDYPEDYEDDLIVASHDNTSLNTQ